MIKEIMDIPAKIIKAITDFITDLLAKLIEKAVATLKLLILRGTLKATWDITKKIAGPVGAIATALYLIGEIEKMVVRVAAFISELIQTISETLSMISDYCITAINKISYNFINKSMIS